MLRKQNEKGSTVACFRGCHFSVTSGVLKVSRFTHVNAQAVVKSRMFGSHCRRHVMSQIFSDEKRKGTRVGEMSSSVKRLRFRLSTVSNRAWMSTSEWPYGVSRRRTGWRVVFLETVLQTGEQVSNVFQGLENDLNRVSSIRACVVLRSCFLSTGKVLAGGLLEK